MEILYIECSMGAAGDMLTAALMELLPDQEAFITEMNQLKIPGVLVKRERSVKCGIVGTQFTVTVDNEKEESIDTYGHLHEHKNEHKNEKHNHVHHHRSLNDINKIVDNLTLSSKVKADILSVYGLIAEAESHAHGVPITDIHFHEVGTMDAIADISAVCLLMDKLAPQQVVVSPIHVGSGHVHCAHGILPVPAPATAYILRDMPIYSREVQGELCTPTGAALLKHFATSFGEIPMMRVRQIGYGMGNKNFEAANCVRVMLGNTEDEQEKVCELSCNVDDMTAEEIGFSMERFFEAGALEVFTVPVGMKKSRPGILIQILCREQDKENMIKAVFKHTSTLGIRELVCTRYILERNMTLKQTPYGEVRRKLSFGYGVTRSKYEYDDLARIATAYQTSLAEAARMIEIEKN